MIGLGSLLKLVKGGGGADELQTILAALGMELDLRPVDETKEAAFTALAHRALHRGASVLQLNGRMANGDTVQALLVTVAPGRREPAKLTGPKLLT